MSAKGARARRKARRRILGKWSPEQKRFIAKRPPQRRQRWKRAKVPPQKRAPGGYSQIWRIVDGAVADCILHHREYFGSNQQVGDARRSIVKRVTGSIIGYLEQSRRGASGATDPGA